MNNRLGVHREMAEKQGLPQNGEPEAVDDRRKREKNAAENHRKTEAGVPPWIYTFVRKLDALMKLRGISQSEMESLSSKDRKLYQSRISRWLNGVGEPNLQQIVEMCVILRAPFGYLADPRRVDAPVNRDLTAEDRTTSDVTGFLAPRGVHFAVRVPSFDSETTAFRGRGRVETFRNRNPTERLPYYLWTLE